MSLSFDKPYIGGPASGSGMLTSSSSSSSGGGGVAGLQLSGANPVQVEDVNKIKLPDWMSTNPDANIQELLKSYSHIGAAFDPTGQVKARNDAIGYNTSAGGQAANNAATEYATRAAQSGTSSLGAGVVKAQAMMPVLAQNAALKTDAADIAAKAHQEGASLAAQVASTIGQLRTSYLNTLTSFVTDQQKTRLQAGQFNSGLAIDKYKAETAAAAESTRLEQSANEQRRLAAMGLLSAPGPSGIYNTDTSGHVTSGKSFYDTLQTWGKSREAAQQSLAGML